MSNWSFNKIINKFKRNTLDINDTDTGKYKVKQNNLDVSLEENLKLFEDIFYECSDVTFKKFKIGTEGIDAVLINIDGLIDKRQVHQEILKPLMYLTKFDNDKKKDISLDILNKTNLNVGEVSESKDLNNLLDGILSGESLLLIDGHNKGILIDTRGWKIRNIEEPESESVNRGPREGFTETLRLNTAMVRRKIKHPDLKIKMMKVGDKSNTDISIMFINGLARKEMVDEVIKRLKSIETDAILESGNIEEYFEDNKYSPFPQIEITERPDIVASALIGGRIAICVDGTPVNIVVPTTIINLLQSPEDYYERPLYASIVRLLRVLGLVIATTLPSLYVALLTFHAHLIPTNLVKILAQGRSGVPFPAFIEALLMQIIVELLREANLRLPGNLGQTIGVVGAIVLGQAAVQAKLASPAMVIVVAITAIGSYVIPRYSSTYPIRLVGYPMIFFASILGIFGIVVVWLWLIIHACSLESLGYPYFSPLSPYQPGEARDSLLRLPLWLMGKKKSTTIVKK